VRCTWGIHPGKWQGWRNRALQTTLSSSVGWSGTLSAMTEGRGVWGGGRSTFSSLHMTTIYTVWLDERAGLHVLHIDHHFRYIATWLVTVSLFSHLQGVMIWQTLAQWQVETHTLTTRPTSATSYTYTMNNTRTQRIAACKQQQQQQQQNKIFIHMLLKQQLTSYLVIQQAGC